MAKTLFSHRRLGVITTAFIGLIASSSVDALTPLQSFRDCASCPEMVMLPPGTFMMGAIDYVHYDRKKARAGQLSGPKRDDGPWHPVTIARPFAIGKYEVTFDEFDEFATSENRNLPADNGWGRGSRPVINVSWHDADDYCAWLGKISGQQYRLPSESEWEYAIRAGTTTAYNFSGEPTKHLANFHNWIQKTVEVGQYPANPWGLHDMEGNVREWVQDWYHETYENAPADGTAWLEEPRILRRVLRGGFWSADPKGLRSSTRYRHEPHVRTSLIGFRCVREG